MQPESPALLSGIFMLVSLEYLESDATFTEGLRQHETAQSSPDNDDVWCPRDHGREDYMEHGFQSSDVFVQNARALCDAAYLYLIQIAQDNVRDYNIHSVSLSMGMSRLCSASRSACPKRLAGHTYIGTFMVCSVLDPLP